MSNLGARGGRIVTRGGHSGFVRCKSNRVRLNNDNQRRKIVFDAAYKIACVRGLLAFTWNDVIKECETPTSVSTARRTFESLVALREAIAERARFEGREDLVMQAKRFGFLE